MRSCRPINIPFDPPEVWRASFLFWPAGPFVAAFPGPPQSKHSQVYVPTAPLCRVPSSQQREGQVGQPSEVNITHQTADNEGSHYNALAPGLRDSNESHKMLNRDHNDHPPLYNQEFPGAVWTHRTMPSLVNTPGQRWGATVTHRPVMPVRPGVWQVRTQFSFLDLSGAYTHWYEASRVKAAAALG